MDLGNSHLLLNGQFVSAKVERVVQAIKDYEPNLEVKWLPPGSRTEGQAAFQICFNQPGQPPYVLFHVATEEEFDERVLARIIQNDQRHSQQTLSDFEAYEAAQKRVRDLEYEDKMAEAADIAYHVMRSPKNTYKVNNDLVIKDGIPFNSARNN